MEKFSQFRDRGTQIAPFLPIYGARTFVQRVYGLLLFVLRLPFFVSLTASYLLLVHWLPVGSLVKKAWLWSLLGVAGLWWVDLQVEGVRRGTLAKQPSRLPKPGSIIVSSYTSPLDVLYLAAVFDPVFTLTYPSTRLVARVPLPIFLWRTFLPPVLTPPPGTKLISLPELLARCPKRPILLFPEATPTNGRGILRFTPALAATPPATQIFPVSLKYTPADITTPIPRSYATFVWCLLSRPTHCVRVRIAEILKNDDADALKKESVVGAETDDEPKICASGAEALARIGRVKRLNLGVKEKMSFIEAWKRNRR